MSGILGVDWGVVPTGFIRKPYAQLLLDSQGDLQAEYGAGINVEPESNFGGLAAIMANRADEGWQLAEAIYNAFNPDAADGVPLLNLCGLTGTVQLPPTYTTVTAFLVGTNGTAIPAGKIAATAGVGSQFATMVAATIATLSAWVTGTTYTAGVGLVTRGGNIYACVGTGVSSGGPSGTGSNITDGTAVWDFVAAGSAAAQVKCKSVASGPVPCYAGTLTTISTPIAGWASVVNVQDHDYLGTKIESDSAIRIRREQELRATGNSSVDAIREKLLEVQGVTTSFVFNNDTDTTDGNGVPPHAIECLVLGGADLDVAQALFAATSGGIATYGSTSVTFTDTQGFSQTVKFSRPTVVPIYLILNLKKGSAWNNSTSAAAEQQAVAAWGVANLKVGGNVIDSQLYVPIFGVGPNVVSDITSVLLGIAPAPGTSTNIVITARQLAAFDTSRITVNAT